MSAKSISAEIVSTKIFFIRGQKVMIDRDLAELYGVTTKVLNQAVKRNIDRFPNDFMFQLTGEEAEYLRSQIVTSNQADNKDSRSQIVTLKKGGRRYLPFAFTEQGVAMLSSILRSKRAAHVNIAIMRAFVKLRETLSLHKELAVKLKELECKVEGHDVDIHNIFEAIRRLMRDDEKPKREIGFHAG